MQQQITLEDLVTECKEYIVLKNKNRLERNPVAGTSQYLLCKEWLKNYKHYIYYQDVKRNSKPVQR